MSWSNHVTKCHHKSSFADATSLRSEITSHKWDHDLCVARNSFVILRLRNFQLNVLSRGSQRQNLSYKKALLDIFGGFPLSHRSPETLRLCRLLLEPSLLNYQFLHFDISQETHPYFTKCTILQKPAVSTAQHWVNLTAVHSSPRAAVDVNLNT